MSQQKKRAATELGSGPKRNTAQGLHERNDEDLVFEDPFGDDMEDEEMIESDGDEEVVDTEATDKDVEMDGEEDSDKSVKKVFMPGVDKLQDDEVLDYDSSAYDMYYAMTAEWPSLSIDVVRDNLGASSNIVATWSDRKKVHLWDIAKQLESLDGKAGAPLPAKQSPVYTFSGHADEGFAMDWSPVQAGRLVTGDCSKFIYLWANSEGAWNVDKVPFTGHKSSVEDLQWSPTETSVFASCSSDRTVRIWDTRRKAGSMLDVTAHDDDVNVITWNRNVAYLLASGSDDGSFKIWDMRNFKADNPVAHFRYHTAPVTSIEWHPTDESVLAVAGADNQISVWDMSVEEDAEAAVPVAGENGEAKLDLPPQLLFIHQGQTDIKELHFHPQCPGVLMSTAGDGFNVFKPANIS
ncbi:hypothetical protein BBO99_00002316 [Phytophthora kernoviae]|uniref:Glutamate-rich WD repeat-containing protein 1 n=1 Tax=Phytophthora kernoviae TaxID=325452 RepID=A0A421GXP9_9STRA|nr:hypothetical protein BBO99_00002316 [Phytophthora kernoviae]